MSSQGTNLGMDVGEEGVGGPTTQLHDEGVWFAIEFEGHGPGGSEAVGANPGKREAFQFGCNNSHPQGLDDLAGVDLMPLTIV